MERDSHSFSLNQFPPTPIPCKTKPLQVNTPSLASTYYPTNGMRGYENTCGTMPNYMTVIESAKAKARSQSTPRQWPSTLERERGGRLAKKKLSYAAPKNHVGSGCSSSS
ncbi:hypothetical protein V6N13_009512 [Hibiscus sabdariffa]|uniref:DUF4005 domain-containing protein n=1 Tax=Hibiscus sabdariffa TaxID=183260 RepID=A0ABR2A8A0_9ROSI